MAHLSGKAGNVYYTSTGATATTIVAGMKSWTLDFTMDALDTTDFGDSGHKTYIPGLDGWSGTFEGFKDGVPVVLGSVSLLELRETTATTQLWAGAAIITGLHESVAVDSVASLTYDYQGTGVLTPPSA